MSLQILLFLLPVMVGSWAQWRVRSTLEAGMRIRERYTGAETARRILDQAGLFHVPVVEIRGEMTDHYDPAERVVRLSSMVYRSATAAAMGIAAHEVGHALQHAQNYLPLVIRNGAVPAATWGSSSAMGLLMLGAALNFPGLILVSLLGFAAVALFQVINLPVEYDASARAKRILDEKQLVTADGATAVNQVLNAAALTYVAATLQSVLTLAYYGLMVLGNRSRRDD